MSPLASILIPCRNAAPWLAATLESALAQSWPRVEVICVDDGSTDDSLAIAQRYQSRGVKVLTQCNAGASAARNHALREARGDFLQFLDADDLLSPGKVEAQIRALGTHGGHAIASGPWGRFTERAEEAVFANASVHRDFSPVEFLVHCSRTHDMMHPGAWLVPRAVADRAGPWDESLTVNDDGEYFCRAMLAADAIVFVPEARSYYRSGRHGSLSQRRDDQASRSQLRSVELICGHMLQAEDSSRTRCAAANYYQRYVYDFFPRPPELMALAERRITELGGADIAPAMGPLTAAAASLVGWKAAWRLKRSGLGGLAARLHRQGDRRK